MNVKTFKCKLIDSNMYIIVEKNEALIVDPWISIEALKYLQKYKIQRILIFLTHEHYDHISGVNWLKNISDKCDVVCSVKCNSSLQSSIKNGSKYFQALFWDKNELLKEKAARVSPYTCEGNVLFSGEKIMFWFDHKISLKECPGHSWGSCCILIDEKYLFSGDSLIKDMKTVTKLPGGNNDEFWSITVPYFKRLPKSTYVYPGHGDSDYIYKMEKYL